MFSVKDPDADITFCSADGTHFQLQRKFLEANTGAFPGSEFDTRGEVVHLTESDSVLRLLFGFVHPRKHPDVEELSFPLLAGVAEAAEKYEVFSAINVCKLQMRYAHFRRCIHRYSVYCLLPGNLYQRTPLKYLHTPQNMTIQRSSRK